ncbi:MULTISPECIES: hypothetical protein [Chitinibacter]|uniref:hypothetical protein n=1 Tax=Chitinibacter TaxID=230666 RepID=UPI0004294037|nr:MULTISPECIES: hypothetical protein [Chitinibacter]
MDRKAALQDFFEAFGLAYSALNVEATCATFVMPFTTNVQGDITHWSEFEPLRQTTEALFMWYYQQGFRSARYKVLEQVMVGSDHATVQLRWYVAREDRHYWVHETGYQLRWVNEGWKICGIMQITSPERSDLLLDEQTAEAWSPLALADEAIGGHLPIPGREINQLQ